MRIPIFIALFALLPVAAVAQSQSALPSGVYRVHKLTLKSTDLSRPMRQNIRARLPGPDLQRPRTLRACASKTPRVWDMNSRKSMT